MRRLWLYLLPFLFLPNLNFSQVTEYGVIELSDRLVVPYIILLLFAVDFRKRVQFDQIKSLMLGFLVWAFIVTATINLRYAYDDPYYVQFGLLKLGKFALYGLAGYLTVKATADATARRGLVISLLASGLAMGIGLMLVGSKTQAQVDIDLADPDPGAGYKASNAVSVFAAMMACYVCGLWLEKRETNPFRRWAMIVAMVALLLGSAISEGRGGWIAGIAGFLYLVVSGSFSIRRLLVVFAVPVVIVLAYAAVPVFHQRVEATIDPNQRTREETTEAIGGVTLGARPEEWMDGIRQFRSPLFGTGFYHRGGESGIYPTGSHNFFLQMFLETGVPGGIVMLMIFVRMWKISGTDIARDSGLTLPVRSALTAAITGAMGGEYFYGGSGLLALFAVYAACGSLPVTGRRVRSPFLAQGETLPPYSFPAAEVPQQ